MPIVLVSVLLLSAPAPSRGAALPIPDPVPAAARSGSAFVEVCLGALLGACLEVMCEIALDSACDLACQQPCKAMRSPCRSGPGPVTVRREPASVEPPGLEAWNACRADLLTARCGRTDDEGCAARAWREYTALPHEEAREDWLRHQGCSDRRIRPPLDEPDPPPPPPPPQPPAGDPPPMLDPIDVSTRY